MTTNYGTLLGDNISVRSPQRANEMLKLLKLNLISWPTPNENETGNKN